MSTPQELLQQALEDIGAQSQISPQDPSHYTVGLQILQNLIERLAVDNIPTAVVFPTALDTEMQEPAYSRQALIDNTKLRLATRLRKTKSINPVDLDNMRQEASESMRTLRNQSRTVKRLVWPLRYSPGTGWRYPYWRWTDGNNN